MPWTFNSVGTKYCGRRDEGADGSYVTTEFVVVGHIPLVPLHTWRVRPSGPAKEWHWNRGWGSYEHTESQAFQTQSLPLDWSQVRGVYVEALAFVGVVILVAAWFGLALGLAAASALAASHDRKVLYILLLVVVVGVGAIIAKQLIMRGRRLTRHTPHEDLSPK